MDLPQTPLIQKECSEKEKEKIIEQDIKNTVFLNQIKKKGGIDDKEYNIIMKDNPFVTEVAVLTENSNDNTEFQYVSSNSIF